MPILHKVDRGSRTLMMTSLYKGHHYDLYCDYSKDIVSSHEDFSKYNGWDYIVIGDEINELFGLNNWRDTWIDAASHCLGMNKWYAIHWIFENFDYDEILFVDFDSKFLRMEKLPLGDKPLKLWRMNQSPYYDTVWFLLYAMHKGMTLEQLESAEPYKFNSGFFKVNRDFITIDALNSYVDFACNTIANVEWNWGKGWLMLHNAKLGQINEMHNTTLTPFDEVFLTHQLIETQCEYDVFDYTYNVNNAESVTSDTVHVHFCTNKKEDMMNMCKLGKAAFLNYGK